MKTIKGSVAVITGAGGGVGRSLATALARQGVHLALVDIQAEALAATQVAVGEVSVRVSTHVVDIADKQQMQALPESVIAEHGQINILINNAGVTFQKSFENHSIEDWERIVGINWWGVLYGCHYFLPYLKAASEGHIVNLSSMNAFIGLASQSSYCATKSAVRLLSESLQAELREHNIGVTSVHPGAIKTEMMKATLADADDKALAQRTYELVQKIGVSPDTVANRIVTAIRKNQIRIRVGADAVLVDWLKRAFPVSVQKLVGIAAKSA